MMLAASPRMGILAKEATLRLGVWRVGCYGALLRVPPSRFRLQRLEQCAAARRTISESTTSAQHLAAAAVPMGAQGYPTDLAASPVPNVWAAGSWPTRDEIATELAAAHVLLEEYGFTELCVLPWLGEDAYLVTPFPILYSEATPELLEGSGSESGNVTGHVIHGACYNARPDINAIVHTHTEAIEAVSTLEDGLELLSQNGSGFYGRVSYHEWEGISTDWDEQASLGASVTRSDPTTGLLPHTLIMRNHGACTFGSSVGQAWVRMYYLDTVCRVALRALGSGRPLRVPSEAVMASAAAEHVKPEFAAGGSEWPALRRQADRLMAARAEEDARIAPYMPAGWHGSVAAGTAPRDATAVSRADWQSTDTEYSTDTEEWPVPVAMRKFLVSSDWPGFPAYLPRSSTLPREVPPSVFAGVDTADADAVAAAIHPIVDAELPEAGVLLFRGLETASDAKLFSQLNAALPWAPMRYIGGTAARSALADGVMTASEDPASVTIEPHQEMAYAVQGPAKLLFACAAAPGPSEGGETVLSDMRAFTEGLDPVLRAEFEKRGVRYTRCLQSRESAAASGTPYCWEGAFFTNDKEVVEKELEALGYEFEWIRAAGDTQDRLKYWYSLPAFRIHRRGDDPRPLWLNQAMALHHTYYLDYPGSEALARACPTPDMFPSNTSWGDDGAAFPQEVIDALRAHMWSVSVAHTWRLGDLLVFDNEAVAHGRMGFSPNAERKVMVALTQN